mmetsp:Transcript_21058/g.65157  ORF Transcript_21058/g.65157 Transcript_21058/m.65157 type:complete len:233 (+) Transcript_21058:974-1672(+)
MVLRRTAGPAVGARAVPAATGRRRADGGPARWAGHGADLRGLPRAVDGRAACEARPARARRRRALPPRERLVVAARAGAAGGGSGAPAAAGPRPLGRWAGHRHGRARAHGSCGSSDRGAREQTPEGGAAGKVRAALVRHPVAALPLGVGAHDPRARLRAAAAQCRGPGRRVRGDRRRAPAEAGRGGAQVAVRAPRGAPRRGAGRRRAGRAARGRLGCRPLVVYNVYNVLKYR